MLNENERHPAVGGHDLEEVEKCFQAASGCADPHNRKRKPGWALIGDGRESRAEVFALIMIWRQRVQAK
jgi:hypothetical protein